MSHDHADNAHLTIRRIQGGALRAYVGERLLAGVTATLSECVGHGGAVWTIKVSGSQVRLIDDSDATPAKAPVARQPSKVVTPAAVKPAAPPAPDKLPPPADAAAAKTPAKVSRMPAIGDWKPLCAQTPRLAIAEIKDGSGACLVRLDGAGARVNFSQSLLVRAMALGMPHPVDRKALIAKIWSTPPSAADTILSQHAAACAAALAPEGLVVKTVRGVGIALQVREDGDA